MRDIVERLREYAEDDHERLCAGRFYDCSCGYDGKRDPLLKEAADKIERLGRDYDTARDAHDRRVRELDAHCVEVARLRNEIKRLRAALRDIIADSFSLYAIDVARTALKEDGDD